MRWAWIGLLVGRATRGAWVGTIAVVVLGGIPLGKVVDVAVRGGEEGAGRGLSDMYL